MSARLLVRIFTALAVATCLAGAPLRAQAAERVTVPAGAPGQPLQLPGWLEKPEGQGPFPGLVLLNGCDGADHPWYHAYGDLLRGWGYVTLLVDSFGPRGFDTVCARGLLVPPRTRAGDAFAAKAYLESLPYVQKGKVGVVGWSHGGWTVMHVVTADAARAAASQPFAAAIAFYPYCEIWSREDATDVLVLIGEKDDWTPAARCASFEEAYAAANHSHRVELVVYPGATHGFDFLGGERTRFGHRMAHDPEAAKDALRRAREFLDERLK